MICQKCHLENIFAPKLFHKRSVLICSHCDEIKTRKIAKNKRLQNIKRLRFRIVLYKKINLNENLIEETI